MSAEYSNIPPQPQTRKGLAIASLVLGIISIPTLGLLVVGAITALVLGAIAIGRTKKEPAIYGGKGMAIGGIITSAVSLLLTAVFCISSAIVVPKMLDSLRSGRETATLNSLRIIHQNQAQYSVMRGRFGDLKELAEAGLLDRSYANGDVISGYVFSSSSVSNATFCIHAVRARGSVASRDFVICEDGIIRFVESKTPGLVKRGEGAVLDPSFDSR